MDYETFLTGLKTKIEAELKAEIDKINLAKVDLVVPYINKFVFGYPDTVKYTDNLVFYFLPNMYSYEPLTSQSKIQSATINVYLTIKGFKDSDIDKIMFRYMSAFYNVFESNFSLNGLVDIIYIQDIKTYDDIEGTQNYKAFEANLIVQNVV